MVKRAKAIAFHGTVCRECGNETHGVLDVHHLTYERLGNESMADLAIVCRPCHEKITQRERTARHVAWAEERYQSRLDAWATKRYGEHWDEYGDADEIEEKFERFLEWADA